MVSILTAADWPVIGQICWVLGKVMDFIYTVLDAIMPSDAGLVGLSIIIYTLLVYTLMLPLTINQQKQTRLSSAMQPELQAIQKKYKNKKDQESQMKQSEEMQAVYDKYGVSMWGGCLPMLIQLPLLFALYPVIYNMPRYVPALETAPQIVNQFLTIPDMEQSPWDMMMNNGAYDLPPAVIVITCIALPVLSGVTQYISVKLSQSMTNSSQSSSENPMNGSMRFMNLFMPLFSVWLVFTLPAGIGLYWVVSAIYRCIQQVVINHNLAKTPIEETLKKAQEKAEKKAEKKKAKAKNAASSERLSTMAQTSTRNMAGNAKSRQESPSEEKAREEKVAKAKESAVHAEEGSLTARANLVQRYNQEGKNSK